MSQTLAGSVGGPIVQACNHDGHSGAVSQPWRPATRRRRVVGVAARSWAGELPAPRAILVISAHWEAAPLTIGSTTVETPLTYDFWGFPDRYYAITYDAPGAPALAKTVEALMPDGE